MQTNNHPTTSQNQNREGAALTAPGTLLQSKWGYTPYQYLPLFAKIAIERLDADSDLRSNIMLDELLDSYAKTYGLQCDSHCRDSAHHICNRRFGSSFSILG